jgi:two-component system response regulator MprA
VDDDRETRETLAAILAEEGFAVRQASNGLEALEDMAAHEPDVVLLDLMMPVMNGWEVLRALRHAQRDVPVVVLSGVPAEGCVDFVSKPISLGRLLTLLEHVRVRSARRLKVAKRAPVSEP